MGVLGDRRTGWRTAEAAAREPAIRKSALIRERYTQQAFASLGEQATSLLQAMMVGSEVLNPNRLLLNETEIGTRVFQIARGWAYRFRHIGTGRRQILGFLLPGEIIGLQAALLGLLEHSVSSLTTLRVNVLDGRLLSEAFRKEPELALPFARYVAAEAARTDELLTVVGGCKAIERLAFLMLSLYCRQRFFTKIDPADCPFPLQRRHMADALGLTGVHIHRSLNRLRQDGVAIIENQRLSILDLSRLAELARLPVPHRD